MTLIHSDLEKRYFIKRSFETISTHFKSGLIALGQSDAAIEHDYELNTTSEFTSEVFFRGKTVCRCRIWRGGLHSQNNISYAEGSTAQMGNASNEILTLQESDNGLYLAALMAGTYTQIAKQFDTRHLTSEQAADYLWRRFVKPMER
jgi:hypothetical protein